MRNKRKRKHAKKNERRTLRNITSNCLSLFTRKQGARQKFDLKLWNRMKLCSLSIFLLWISSLKVATFIASHAIVVPSITSLYHSCKSALQVAREEKKKFEICANTQISKCMTDLDLMSKYELNRVQLSSQHNSKIVKKAQKIADECTLEYNDLRNALDDLTSIHPRLLPFKNDTCSSEEIDTLMNSVISTDTYKSEAFLVAAEFEQHSKSTMDNIIEYAKVRAEYDKNYIQKRIARATGFFDLNLQVPSIDISGEINQVMNSVGNWAGCLSISNRTPCKLVDGMISSHELILKFHKNAIEKATKVLDKTRNAYKEKYEQIREMHENIMDRAEKWTKIFIDMKNVIEYVNRRLPKRKSGGWFEISIEDMIPPDFISDLEFFEAKLSPPQELIDAANRFYDEKIQSKALEAFYHMSTRISENFDAINEGYENWVHDIQSTFNFERVKFFQDYDPPKYTGTILNISNFDDERKHFIEKSKIFMTSITNTIENVANASGSANATEEKSNFTFPEINATTIRAKVRNFNTQFEEFTNPTIDFDVWLLDIISFEDVLIIADFVLRVYLSIRLCFKYWSVSSVKLPDIDIRVQRNEFKANPLQWNNGKLFVALVSNPLTGLLLLSIVVSWIVSFTTSVYLPVLMDYKSGCVELNSNGTFISENLYSFAYNYAYNTGSSDIIKGTEKIEAIRMNTCSEQAPISATKQDDDRTKIAQNSHLVSSINNRLELYGQCINVDQLDIIFSELCCDWLGYNRCSVYANDSSIASIVGSNKTFYCPVKEVSPPKPYELPSKYIQHHSCNSTSMTLYANQVLDAVFDCSRLPSCDITCVGPHKQKLKTVTKECGCTGEWIFHSFWLRNIVSFLIYIIMNTSRVSFIDGLSRVLWRHLHPGGFTVWVNCNASGEILQQKAMLRREKLNQIEGSQVTCPLSRYIKKQLDWNSLKFRMGGFIMVLGSVSINGIWIGILFRINDDLRLMWL